MHHTYRRVIIAHAHKSCDRTHTNESRHTHRCVTLHMSTRHITLTNESRPRYIRVTSCIQIRHVPDMNVSVARHAYKCVTPRIWKRHLTRKNKSHPTRVTCHIKIRHFLYMNASSHTQSRNTSTWRTNWKKPETECASGLRRSRIMRKSRRMSRRWSTCAQLRCPRITRYAWLWIWVSLVCVGAASHGYVCHLCHAYIYIIYIYLNQRALLKGSFTE